MTNRHIYFLQESSLGAIKIGFAANVNTRKCNIQGANPSKVTILGAIPGGPEEETKIHEQFAHLRIRGEWFKPGEDLLEFIRTVTVSGRIPIDLGKAVLDFSGENPTEEGKQCKKWIEMVENLPEIKEDEELLNVDMAASMLGISKQTLRNWDEKERITSIRTEGGHRRYNKKDILNIRKQQMQEKELLIPEITPNDLLFEVQRLISGFDPMEKINISLRQDTMAKKVKLTIDSVDGLNSIAKSFNIKE